MTCQKEIYINRNLSIIYLSDMLDLKRETVSRYIKILIKKDLIIMEKGKIINIDRQKLAKYFKSL
ncbi:helix-turn-helix domain-containing protein [Garciella nitratireducens]|uniref:helix-turn-helix domain-containing protein n=1 Tax=Garciella nitratireducens TaxID=218205 RepID=UPI001BD408C9